MFLIHITVQPLHTLQIHYFEAYRLALITIYF